MACYLTDKDRRCAFRCNDVNHRCWKLSFPGPVNNGLGQTDCKSGRVPGLSLGHNATAPSHEEIAQPAKLKEPSRRDHSVRGCLGLGTGPDLYGRMKVDERFNFVASLAAQGVRKNPGV